MKKVFIMFLIAGFVAGCSSKEATKDATETKSIKIEEEVKENMQDKEEEIKTNLVVEKTDELSITLDEEEQFEALVERLYELEKQQDIDTIAEMAYGHASSTDNHTIATSAYFIYDEIWANGMIIEEYELKEMKKVKEHAVHIIVSETRAGETKDADLILLKDFFTNEWVFNFEGTIDQYLLNYTENTDYGEFGDFMVLEFLDGRTTIWFEVINTSLDYEIYLGRDDFRYTLVTEANTYTVESSLNLYPGVLESAKTITPNSHPFNLDVTFTNVEGKFQSFIYENVELIDKNGNRTLVEEVKVEFPDNYTVTRHVD